MILRLEVVEVVATDECECVSFRIGPTKLWFLRPFECEVDHKWKLDNPELLVRHVIRLYYSQVVQNWLSLAESSSRLHQHRFRQLAVGTIVNSRVQGDSSWSGRIEVEGQARINTYYGSLRVKGCACLSQHGGTGNVILYPLKGTRSVPVTVMYVSAGYEILIQRVSSDIDTFTGSSDVTRITDVRGLRRMMSSRTGVIWIPAYLARRRVVLFWGYFYGQRL